MIVPIRKNKNIDTKYYFKRDIPKGLKICVEKGDKIRKDTVLASGEMSEEKIRIDLVSSLKVEFSEAGKYLKCLNGERIKRGEILALKKKGVVQRERKLFAPTSGVVDLSEIDSGILKILSVATESTINAGIEGEVVSVIKNKHVNILSEVLEISAFECVGRDVQGELFFLDDDSVIDLGKDEFKVNNKNEDSDKIEVGENLNGGIVAMNFSPSEEFIRKLIISGVGGIITGGIDYKIKRMVSESDVTICNLSGYGKIAIEKKTVGELKTNDGFLCSIDIKENNLLLTNVTKGSLSEALGLVRNLEIGDKVQILDTERWGEYAIVKEINRYKAVVRSKRGKRYNIHYNNLLLI